MLAGGSVWLRSYWLDVGVAVIALLTLVIVVKSIRGPVDEDAPLPSQLLGRPTYSIDAVSYDGGPKTYAVGPSHTLVFPEGRAVTIAGWAIDQRRGSTAGGVSVLVDGTHVSARYGFVRDDVARYFHNAAEAECGFAVRIDPAMLPTGTHHIDLDVQSNDRGALYRENDALVLVISH
jgi:hypothetical protein